MLCEVKNDDGTVCPNPVNYRMRRGMEGWFGCCAAHWQEHTADGTFSGYEFEAV